MGIEFDKYRLPIELALDNLWYGVQGERVLVDDQVCGSYKLELVVEDNQLYCWFTYRKVFGRFVKKPNNIYRINGIIPESIYRELVIIITNNLQCRDKRRKILKEEFCQQKGE